MNLKITSLSRLTNKLKIKPNVNFFRLSHTSSVSSRTEKNNEISEFKFNSTIERNRIFNEQLQKQKDAIGRLNKIEVKVLDCKPLPNTTMLMNQNLSTPLDCARHLNELYVERSIIAKVDGQIWDMHRPLENNCKLTFHHFNEQETYEVNKAFWRSCSFLLGKVITNSFKEEIPIYLHSWPKPNFKSGSFVYDVQLPTLANWQPRENELIALTKSFCTLYERRLQFERLDLPIAIVKQIFKDNPFKMKQLEAIEAKCPNSNVTVYRVGKFIDFSVGPMIPHTAVIGKINVAAVYQLEASCGKLYRFQGCALPTQLPMHFYAWNMLVNKAKRLSYLQCP